MNKEPGVSVEQGVSTKKEVRESQLNKEPEVSIEQGSQLSKESGVSIQQRVSAEQGVKAL